MGQPVGAMGSPPPATGAAISPDRTAFVPLGLIADVSVVEGPPMVRNENGLLVGYVYVDVDESKRDIGGFVEEAKATVEGAIADRSLALPAGTVLEWTGQYEEWKETRERLEIVLPLTALLIIVLLFFQFRNLIEVLIILLSVPFALVGSIWLLWLLDYRLSTAVWVGIIALAGLAAQTGIVMILYIDQAYERRKRAGKIRDLDDIIWAHMEGTVERVRPKLMTVATMLVGLIPLLWATGSGADVMKRIAAPMVGGLITSAFLTLEIIPVIYTYWRFEQLLLERTADRDPARHGRMRRATHAFWLAFGAEVALLLATIYVPIPTAAVLAISAVVLVIQVAALVHYFTLRPAARRSAWPTAPPA